MEWHEISINTTYSASEAVSQLLMDMGANGVVIEDAAEACEFKRISDGIISGRQEAGKALCDGQATGYVTIKAYIAGNRMIDEIKAEIQEGISGISVHVDTGKTEFKTDIVNDEDWADSWKKYFKPFNITDKLVVKPSWEEYRKKDSENVIVLDPGMAFGTGTHETTRMCAVLIEKYIKEGFAVADIGCGSGILSICASLLGAEEVFSVDTDEVAVRVTLENFKQNGINTAQAVKGDHRALGNRRFDLAAANIIADVLIGFSGEISGYLKEGAFLILSGIISSRREDTLSCYLKKGFLLYDEQNLGEWVALALKWPGFSQIHQK